MKMLMAHIDRTPVPPSQRTELPVPRELERVILACLEKDPARRPQNARELWKMSLACPGADTWSQTAASRWWEAHLPQLTTPHVLAVPAFGPASESALSPGDVSV